MIAKTRSQRASGLSYLMGIFLMSSGVPVDVITVFNKMGISMSYPTLTEWFKKLHVTRKKEIFDEVQSFYFSFCVCSH